jgi:hypothetical protein
MERIVAEHVHIGTDSRLVVQQLEVTVPGAAEVLGEPGLTVRTSRHGSGHEVVQTEAL